MSKAIAFRPLLSLSIVAVLLGLAVVHAQTVGLPDLRRDLLRQEDIYRTRGRTVPQGYVTTRELAHYEELLPARFASVREALGPHGRWLDVGAGSGQAVVDFARRTARDLRQADAGDEPADARGRLVALSIEDRRTADWHEAAADLRANEIRYLHGKRLRDVEPGELGRFDLVTDVYGGFSYTDDLSAFMERLLALLEPGGSFFTLIQGVHLADGRERPQTWFLTEIADAAGRDVTPCAWLKRIACVQVTCESRSDWDPATELIEVRKLCEPTAVPRLVAVSYEAGTPPGRKFLLPSDDLRASGSAR